MGRLGVVNGNGYEFSYGSIYGIFMHEVSGSNCLMVGHWPISGQNINTPIWLSCSESLSKKFSPLQDINEIN